MHEYTFKKRQFKCTIERFPLKRCERKVGSAVYNGLFCTVITKDEEKTQGKEVEG